MVQHAVGTPLVAGGLTSPRGGGRVPKWRSKPAMLALCWCTFRPWAFFFRCSARLANFFCIFGASWQFFWFLATSRNRFWSASGKFREGFGGSRPYFSRFGAALVFYYASASWMLSVWQEWYETHIAACRLSSARCRKRPEIDPSAS